VNSLKYIKVSYIISLCLGIVFLNPPLYIEDKLIDKKISMLNGISNSNFNEVNEIKQN